MQYQEIYEASHYYNENKALHQLDGFYINKLFDSACNYLMYGEFNEEYFLIYDLTDGIYHQYHDRLVKDNPYKIPLFKGVGQALRKVFRSLSTKKLDLTALEIQVLMSCCINIERVKHTGSQFSTNDLTALHLATENDLITPFKDKFPAMVSTKTADLSLKRMNRFLVITEYLIAKFDLKYPPRIPRLDDFSKLVASLEADCTIASLNGYFDRMDTAKFDSVSVYSTWNVCYYKNIRNQLIHLPESVLEKQYKSFRKYLLDHRDKLKPDSSEAIVYDTLIHKFKKR